MSQNMNQTKSASAWTYIQPFFIGGVGGCTAMATCYPIEMVKARIQMRSEAFGIVGQRKKVSSIGVAQDIYKNSGIRGFYKGLDSSLTRQLCFSTTRLGVYKIMFAWIQEKEGSVSPGKKVICALTAGFWAAVAGNPADVAMVRMQADPTLPLNERRNYTNVFNAFWRIIQEEGVVGLWKGSLPTIARGMAVNLGMLAPYDEIRERLNKYTGTVDTMSTKLIASAGAGFLCSFLSLPFDNMKVKLQKMKPDSHGSLPYSGLVDCFTKSVKREGFTKLWVGFASYYLRTGTYVMIALMTQDKLENWFKARANRA